MANWNGLILTDLGRALQAKVEAGQTLLILTKFKLGNGVISGGQALERLTDLVSPKQIIGINTCVPSENGLCTITGVVVNTGLTTGYELKELGVFATDPDLGEILYAITIDNHPDYLQAEGGATVVSEEFNLNIAISNTSNVTAVIDTAGLATIGNINTLISEHNTSETAHEDIRTAIAEATKKAGLPVGFEYTIPYTELQAGQIPLLGGKYLKSTYADLWKWVQTHPSMIVTETEWQSLKTASGGRAVAKYANVDDTHFRVPLNTVWERGASSLNEIGTYFDDAIRNIVASTRIPSGIDTISGAFYQSAGNVITTSGSIASQSQLNFDASRVVPTAEENRPKTIARLWVVQAFGTLSNVGNLDMAQLAADLVTKVDVDCQNVTSAGKKIMAGMSMPSATFETIVDAGATTTYTAPANGYVYAYINKDNSSTTNVNRWLTVESKLKSHSNVVSDTGANQSSCYIPVLKGDVATIKHDPDHTGVCIKFYYAEGEI